MALYGFLLLSLAFYGLLWQNIVFSRGHRSKFIWSCFIPCIFRLGDGTAKRIRGCVTIFMACVFNSHCIWLLHISKENNFIFLLLRKKLSILSTLHCKVIFLDFFSKLYHYYQIVPEVYTRSSSRGDCEQSCFDQLNTHILDRELAILLML